MNEFNVTVPAITPAMPPVTTPKLESEPLFAGIFNNAFDAALAQLVDAKVSAALSAKGGSVDTTAVENIVGDALDSYDPTTYSHFDSSVESVIEDYNFNSIIDARIDGDEFVSRDDFDSKVDEAVESAIDDHDFSDAIESAIDDYDLGSKIRDALEEFDMDDKIAEKAAEVVNNIVKAEVDAAVGIAVANAFKKMFAEDSAETDVLYVMVKKLFKQAVTSNF